MTLVQITNYTSPNRTDRPQVNIHCIENLFTVHDFWATCACPEKNRVALKFFTVLNILFTFRIFSNLRLPWKQSFPWNFSLYWIYFLPFRIFEQLCACTEKQSCPGIFHCIEYTFYIHEFWATCMRLPWKTEGALNSQYWLYIFYHSGFFEQLALSLKNRVALKFFAVWNILFYIVNFWGTCACREKQRVPWIYCTEYIFFIIQEFWPTCACPEKQSCPGIFHCIEYTLYIHEFWATSACPEKQSCPEIFRCMEYTFYIRDFWATCACPENRGCPEIFHCIEYIFYYSGVLSNLRLPWKQSCPGIFHCVEYTFYIQNFWTTCAFPEKQRVSWIHYIECIFFIQDFWATCACPEKQRVPWKFSLYWIHILLFWSFE